MRKTIWLGGEKLNVRKADFEAYVASLEMNGEKHSEPFPFHVERNGVLSVEAELLTPDDIDV